MKFGWIPDIRDDRDLRFAASPLATARKDLPQQIDLRSVVPRVYNQGDMSSCTGHAVAAAVALVAPWAFRESPGSRLYAYWFGRAARGEQNEDGGASIRDVLKGLAREGLAPESMWPYDRSHLFREPTTAVRLTGAEHKVVGYRSVNTASPDEMRACLATLTPFVFGARIHRSFLHPPASGVIPMPSESEEELGGHAMLCVGYHHRPDHEAFGRWDDAWGPGLFIVQNSWGTDWGKDGFCYLPYWYLTGLARDAWAIEAVA